MKLFAKRTRKAVDDAEAAEKLLKEQTERDADKVVEELLNLDPSELNSKQRRLVKRYKERNKSDDAQPLEEKNESKESIDDFPKIVISDEAKRESRSSSDRAPIAYDAEDMGADMLGEPKEESGENVLDESKEKEAADDAGKETSNASVSTDSDYDDAANNVDEGEVKKLLEKLNSKQRRKLMRQLEREGDDVLKEVHEEAVRLLKVCDAEKEAVTETVKKETNVAESSSKSGKKRKKDWSELTPEERLRREEQRRMQKEAAERRGKKGNTETKRHPLNSQRRRANRRKPKWENKRKVEEAPDDEHNTSGYHMRRLKKAGEI